MALDLLWNRAASPIATILLAHGAGGAMDSPWMTTMTGLLADRGIHVARFEFAYMAGRRSGVRKPPPRGDSLVGEFRDAVAAVSERPLLIGGKSMGGRVASLVADDLHAAGDVAGLVCLGYPFHPLGKPEQLRTAHLASLSTPTLICQGTRDAFGTREEVADYNLSGSITMEWLEDGDHDLRPRKAVSGFTHAQHLATTADAIVAFAARISR